jgi:hypothetical protein
VDVVLVLIEHPFEPDLYSQSAEPAEFCGISGPQCQVGGSCLVVEAVWMVLYIFVPSLGNSQPDAYSFRLHAGSQRIDPRAQLRRHDAVGVGTFFILENYVNVLILGQRRKFGCIAANDARGGADGILLRLIRYLLSEH